MRISDWSSDVCSSDLDRPGHQPGRATCRRAADKPAGPLLLGADARAPGRSAHALRPGHHRLAAGPRRLRSADPCTPDGYHRVRSEDPTFEPKSLIPTSYASFSLNKKTQVNNTNQID